MYEKTEEAANKWTKTKNECDRDIMYIDKKSNNLRKWLSKTKTISRRKDKEIDTYLRGNKIIRSMKMY